MKGYRRSNPNPPSSSGRLTSHPTDRGGAQAQCGGAIGGSLEFRSRALRGMVTQGFGGKMTRGSTGFSPEAKHDRERL
jgi:hypothetical protein